MYSTTIHNILHKTTKEGSLSEGGTSFIKKKSPARASPPSVGPMSRSQAPLEQIPGS